MSDVILPGGITASVGEESSLPVALQQPTKVVSIGFIILYCLAVLVIWMCIFPVLQILIPLQITALDPSHKITAYSAISVVGALTSLVTFPVAGALSDRTTLRWGRRRPWIITGTIGAAILLAFLANAPSVLALAIGWVMFTIFANIAQAGLFTLLPDQVPARQRATVSAGIGLSVPIGIALGSALIGRLRSPHLAYYVLIGLLVIFVSLFTLVLREEPLPQGVMPPLKLKSFVKSFWINPVKAPDFGWAWFTRFLLSLSYACVTAYLFFFLADAVHYQQIFPGRQVAQGVANFQLISTAFLLVASLSSAVLSDRLQRRKVFVIAAGCLMGLALLLLAFLPSWPVVLIAAGVLGLGYGLYTAIDFALVSLVLPSARDRGKDLGIINIAATLPQALTPILAAFVINSFHSYMLLFAIAAVFAFLAAALIPRIRGVR